MIVVHVCVCCVVSCYRISNVYGKHLTFKAKSVRVFHHTAAHGQRYEVNRENLILLPELIRSGRASIRSWILKHVTGSDQENQLGKFDEDNFFHFIPNDI